jgi:AraC-like DNA-binding protein
MTNYYTYLPVSREDENWGLYVLNAGYNQIQPSAVYPQPAHPSHHYFNWQAGRILDEYQVIYITKGSGIFESASCSSRQVIAGNLLFLFPGEWHRFKPDAKSGWEEWWIGFKGPVAASLVQQHFFHPGQPLLSIGVHTTVIQLLQTILEATKEEKAGYQPLIAGAVLHLLGNIHAITRQQLFVAEDRVEIIVKHAMGLFRTGIDNPLSVEKVAEALGVGYAWFRKAFKQYTGIAPGQYMLELKMEKAKQLLSTTAVPVKEIAFQLSFESASHFSKLFKSKTGSSPVQYRDNNQYLLQPSSHGYE